MQGLRSAAKCLRGRHPVHVPSGGARCGAALAQRLRPGAREAVGETARADAQDGRSGGQDGRAGAQDGRAGAQDGRAGGQDGRAGGQDDRAAAISELQQAKAQAGVAVERKKAINILAEARKEATQIVRGPGLQQLPPRTPPFRCRFTVCHVAPWCGPLGVAMACEAACAACMKKPTYEKMLPACC